MAAQPHPTQDGRGAFLRGPRSAWFLGAESRPYVLRLTASGFDPDDGSFAYHAQRKATGAVAYLPARHPSEAKALV
jgi:hypothetical protein